MRRAGVNGDRLYGELAKGLDLVVWLAWIKVRFQPIIKLGTRFKLVR